MLNIHICFNNQSGHCLATTKLIVILAINMPLNLPFVREMQFNHSNDTYTTTFLCVTQDLLVFLACSALFDVHVILNPFATSQRRVYKPSRRTRPFAATGYELANLAAEALQHASAI